MAGLLRISSKRLSSWKHVTSLFKCPQHEQRAVQAIRNCVILTSVGIQDQHKLYCGIQLREIHMSRSLADDHGKFSSVLLSTKYHCDWIVSLNTPVMVSLRLKSIQAVHFHLLWMFLFLRRVSQNNYYRPHPKDDGRLYFHFVCQSTPRPGGGVSQVQVQVGGGTQSSHGWGGPRSQIFRGGGGGGSQSQ